MLYACSSVRSIQAISEPPLLGIIADCQYADAPTNGVRHYRLSPGKLTACIDTFNTLELSHVFHLGDFIDKHGMESMEVVLPLMSNLAAAHTFVLGNHDFSFPDSLKTEVPRLMGLNKRYFSMKMNDWKFIILDGNDVSLYAWPPERKEYLAAKKLHDTQYPDSPTYNGALGADQLNWLKKELKRSEKASEKVILLCHFPVLPVDNHILWNSQEVIDLITGYSCVKAWMNGHNHAGGYAEHEGIHFITFKGMVDTETNAFGTIQLHPKQIVIDGHGREPDRILNLRESKRRRRNE